MSFDTLNAYIELQDNIIDIKDFYRYYNSPEYKCITIEMVRLIGKKCDLGYTPPIDYLKAVDDLYFK